MCNETSKKMKKIKVAIVGYGNIGRYVLHALETAADLEVAGIIRRSTSKKQPIELQSYQVVQSIKELASVDVAILCVPSREVASYAKAYLKLGIRTVDSFDIHSDIAKLRSELTPIAKQHQVSSIISAGWDPGSDSIIRALLQMAAPQGITYTNFGPGMSMGHTVAVKAIEGVKKALSMTIPTGTGIHRRMVYVELNPEVSFEDVAESIKNDNYFINDETHVTEVNSVDDLIDMGHGVNITRKGTSGTTPNQLFEFNMRINNPALTAQILVSSARATMRQQPGSYTLIEIPLVDFLPGDREAWIHKLV